MGNILLKKYAETDKNRVKAITEPAYGTVFDQFAGDTISLLLEGDTLVGWLHLDPPPSSLYSGFVFVYISPAYRRRGIGTFAYRQAEARLNAIGCNWWSSYPESEAADRFALAVGFDYTNTNSYLVHDGRNVPLCADGIRPCRIEDYPTAPDLWSREYAAMHRRLGLPYETREFTAEERKASYEEFCASLDRYFVLEIGGRIVGVGILFSDCSGIGGLAVDVAYSGNGYGTRLAAFLTNECIRRGCPHPCLYCEGGNDNAMHIYRKIGYVEKGQESVAIKN